MKNTLLAEFFGKVSDELIHQDKKHGPQRDLHPLVWQSIALEEIGEIAQELNDSDFTPYQNENYEKEVIQVAACMFRMYAQNRINTKDREQKKLY